MNKTRKSSTTHQHPTLKYMAFDMDDNILMLPTKIHMEQLVDSKWVKKDISTELFSKIRNDKSNWRPLVKNNKFIAYNDFSDDGNRGSSAFLEDLIVAIKNKKFGPSWEKFINCLKTGNLFAIITARGHESEVIRKGIEWIIFNILDDNDRNEMAANLIAYKDLFIIDYDIIENINLRTLIKAYLDKCEFIGVTSPSFIKKHNVGDASSPEYAKILAMESFVNTINNYGKQVNRKVKIGFSDDDLGNINKVEEYFNEIDILYKNISFYVYDTSNPLLQKGKKKKILKSISNI